MEICLMALLIIRNTIDQLTIRRIYPPPSARIEYYADRSILHLQRQSILEWAGKAGPTACFGLVSAIYLVGSCSFLGPYYSL